MPLLSSYPISYIGWVSEVLSELETSSPRLSGTGEFTVLLGAGRTSSACLVEVTWLRGVASAVEVHLMIFSYLVKGL